MNSKYQKSAANGVSAGAEPISNEDFMKIFGGSQNELNLIKNIMKGGDRSNSVAGR